MSDFNFDEWATLAKEDPEAFEEKRKRTIERHILLAPQDIQPKLRGMQFSIDSYRRTHTPLAVRIKLENDMFESFERLRQALKEATQSKPLTPDKPIIAQVIEFKRR